MDHVNKHVPERDCAVCLQVCHYPTELPCGHVFCFLCLKGVAIQNKKCAICRAEIPLDYLNHPKVLQKLSPETAMTQSGEYQWYYEGSNGWWRYDERSNSELEAAYGAGESQCKLLLAGALYCIDFQTMRQVQSRDPTKRRHVIRDVPTLPAKGIAGIKIINIKIDQTKTENDQTVDNVANQNETERVEAIIEVGDNDTIEVNDSESESTQQPDEVSDLIQRVSSIDLRERRTNGNE